MSNVLHQVRFRRDHRWAPAHMSAYLDNELLSRAKARMERHTAECPECRGVLHSLRRMLGVLERAPQPSPGADTSAIAAAVRQRLHEPG